MSCQMTLQTIINLLSIALYSSNISNYIIQPSIILFIVQIFLLLISLGVLGLVGQLTVFHLWLRYHGLTTFELIKLQREFEEKEKYDAEQGRKTGGTNLNQLPSGLTSHMGEVGNKEGKITHKTSINNNIISDDHPREHIQNAQDGKLKRRGLNMSSDQFLNINIKK